MKRVRDGVSDLHTRELGHEKAQHGVQGAEHEGKTDGEPNKRRLLVFEPKIFIDVLKIMEKETAGETERN